MTAGMLLFIFIVGGALFLIFNHPVIFWLVAVPLVLCLIIGVIRWLKK